MNIVAVISEELKIKTWQTENVIKLLDEGCTVPFIARYRKESHGTLDDQSIRVISERLEYLRNLQKRKEEIYSAIEKQEKMTPEIADSLEKATTMVEIEDIYRPFKQKKKTRASVAKEKGLEPLAEYIYSQQEDSVKLEIFAEQFINEEKEVNTVEDAINGALDIIAEYISDNAEIRRRLRNLFLVTGKIEIKAVDEENENVYDRYYNYTEPVEKIADHRILAIDRGEKEDFLKVKVSIDHAKAINVIRMLTLKNNNALSQKVMMAGKDACDRLILPSVEREIRSMLTQRAAESAIRNFSNNLKPLLMQPPIKNKVAIGLDPGYRTGCKVAVVDKTGKVLDTGVIYVTHSQEQKEKAKELLKKFIEKYSVDIIAIGNGTASKETEIFTAELLRSVDREVSYMVVSEAGASVYSASKLAAEEFPQFDVALRSAVSIARRLQDPLAELVKIDPKAIGVGQYQHDMPKKELDTALGGVVEDCVNSVGVDLNTASPSLLSMVSGINSTVAKNIVEFREKSGAFDSREKLKKVPRLGGKAYEQCAGFLRISGGKNILDNTGVHPESYEATEKILNICSYNLDDVLNSNISDLSEKIESIGKEKVAEQIGVGVPTLEDIVKEITRPGRDPRDTLPPPMLRTDVMDINDLKIGMEMKGTVRNVIDFGVFVDIGVHRDGLVHISQISQKNIKHPSEVLQVGDIVTVWIKEVDVKKNRISLTMLQEKLQKDIQKEN